MSRRVKLPLSGYEPTFSLQPWQKYLQSNNCYAYSVGDFASFRTEKSVPGARSGRNRPHSYQNCNGLLDRVIADNPRKVYKASKYSSCMPGYYKIMMVSGGGDFHFYKQHGWVRHKVKATDTWSSISSKYQVSYASIRRTGPIRPGKTLYIKVNLWSHKRGWGTGPLLHDACNRLIRDPSTACRRYQIDYNNYCGSLCVRNKGIRVGRLNTKRLHKNNK